MKKIFLLLTMFFSPSVLAVTEPIPSFGLLWAIPFVGMLLSIAIVPVIGASLWHHHVGKIAAFWGLSFVLPALLYYGSTTIVHLVSHAVLLEYIPFMILIGALYVISGGIYIKGNLHGTPIVNTCILALGAVLASMMGTTGAAMLLIRPLLRANDNRKHKVHVVVFFIFVVANVGGSLTPLGDPPLFIGFLKGVPFFWTMQHIGLQALVAVAILLLLFFALDSYFYRHHNEELPTIMDSTPDTRRMGLDGGLNFVWLVGAIGFVLQSGLWQSDVLIEVLGTPIALQNVIRDVGLLFMAGLSWWTTAQRVRVENQFNFEPIAEVAKLFLVIFITIAPVILMLSQGADGVFADLIHMVHDDQGQPINARYFWATGLLSGFLDNAPTYLVFFNLTGVDVGRLTTEYAGTLAAISAGSVFMGALSYIGNAPNFMIKSIAEHSGVKMPSFLGYMLWSFTILLPLFVVLTILFY